MSTKAANVVVVWVIAVIVIIGVVVEIAVFSGAFDPGGGGTFADDMNRACARHARVFWMNAQQGGGVCRDGTAVAP